MSERNTVIRSMHDLGLAAWFGGSLMGAVGVNGAASEAKDPRERLRLASAAWMKWAPVQAAALMMHAVGGVGLVVANRERLMAQPESRTNTLIKTALTLAAAGVTLYSGVLGMRVAKRPDEDAVGATEPAPGASAEIESAQNQFKVLQWIPPVLTAVIIVLAAQQGEQQRPIAGLAQSKLRWLIRR